MFDIKINENQINKMEYFFKEEPKIFEKIVKSALTKAGNKIKQTQKKHISSRYEVSEMELNSKNLTLEKKSDGVGLVALTKSRAIENFKVSLQRPGRSKERMSASVLRSTGMKEMRTMFWGFYKSSPARVGLYFRKGSGKYEVKRVRSLSVFQMGKTIPADVEKSVIQKIFDTELEKNIIKELNKL